MIDIQEKSGCCGCSACTQSCPVSAITMERDGDGFLYPQINRELCIECGLCERVCPMLQEVKKSADQPSAFAYKTQNTSVRTESSSGGAFTDLASLVLREGGVVFGAAFAEDFSIEHIAVESEEALFRLRGSKYAQSRIGDTYRKAEEYLKAGRRVLFSGTPCQISGLYSYLHKPYHNLIAIDFICHGVPSPAIWERYVDYRTEQAGATIPTSISFRDKSGGWKRFRMRFDFANGQKYAKPHYEDEMMRVFLQDLCLRESCYSCNFRGNRPADITLADFWGIGAMLPAFDDDRGASLVLLNTEKGKELFASAMMAGESVPVDFQKALSQNPAYFRSPARPSARDVFITDALSGDFASAAKRYCKKPRFALLRKIKRRIKAILHR